MKRWIIIAMALAWVSAQGQDVVRDTVVADTAAEEENVIGGRVSPHARPASEEPNIIGMPVYYDLNGNVVGSGQPAHTGYRMPKHHYHNNLGLHYSSVFLECLGMFGPNPGVGLSLAYVPQRWGFYASGLVGKHRNHMAVGPVLRVTDAEASTDMQLYGGLVFNRRLGGEVGVRLAATRRNSDFSWLSGSMGVGYLNGHTFVTLGLSLEITAAVVTSIYFW